MAFPSVLSPLDFSISKRSLSKTQGEFPTGTDLTGNHVTGIFCAGSTIFFPSAASRSIDGRRHGGLSFLPGKNKPAPIPGLMASGSGITRLTGAYLHPETQKSCIAPAAGRLKKPSGSPAAPWPPHNGVRPGRRKQCRRRNPPLRRMGTGPPDRDAPAWRGPLECARGSWCASHSQ